MMAALPAYRGKINKNQKLALHFYVRPAILSRAGGRKQKDSGPPYRIISQLHPFCASGAGFSDEGSLVFFYLLLPAVSNQPGF